MCFCECVLFFQTPSVTCITLIWVGFLGVRFEVVGGGKIIPCLKPVRIMLETLKLARNYAPICSFRKYTIQCLGPLNFADVSIFLQKNSVFCPKKYLYSKQQCESCVRDFLALFTVFIRQKVTITENIIFADSVPGISKFSKITWVIIPKVAPTKHEVTG